MPRRSKNSRPIAVDLFCGVGGMSLGFEQAGFHIAGAVDSEPINIATHHINFPSCVALQRDLSKTSGSDLLSDLNLRTGEIDVLFGGPPCQGFSLMGKRRMEDERNQLFLHFARLIRELRPRYFIVENVRGLLMGTASRLVVSFMLRMKRA